MTMAKHCDGPGCDSWQHEDAVLDYWMTLSSTHPVHGTQVKHFCQPWCALKHLSEYAEPPEVIELY